MNLLKFAEFDPFHYGRRVELEQKKLRRTVTIGRPPGCLIGRPINQNIS